MVYLSFRRYIRFFDVISEFSTLYPIFWTNCATSKFLTLYMSFKCRIKLLDVKNECTKYCAISEFSTLYPNFRPYIRILDIISGYIKRCATSKFWTLFSNAITEFWTLYPKFPTLFSIVRIIVLYPIFRRYIRIFDVISEFHMVSLGSFFTNYCARSEFRTLPTRYWRYIWTLDVISETSTVYPNVLNSALYPNFWRYIRSFGF